jgi:AcrR family transcriptional regulator
MPYRPTDRTEARKARAREAILGAAIDQLADGGYASATVQAVAERASVATGTLYRHFPSKADLFAEAFRRASTRELDVFAEAMAEADRSVAERVATAVEAFARRALASPTRAYALIAEPVDPAVEAERLAFRRGYRDLLVRVLQDGVDSGELAAHDSQTVAAALVGAIGEALVGPLSPANGHRRRREALIASLIQFCLSSLPTKEAVHVAARAHA